MDNSGGGILPGHISAATLSLVVGAFVSWRRETVGTFALPWRA